MLYCKYNANPKGWKTGDCVVRSISTATFKSWSETLNNLYKIAAKKCRMPNDVKVYTKYLEDNGFIQMKQMKHSNNTKYTIDEVIEAFPEDILLIHCAHHLTCAINGILYDTWNCGWRTAGKFYRLDKSLIDKSRIQELEENTLKYRE